MCERGISESDQDHRGKKTNTFSSKACRAEHMCRESIVIILFVFQPGVAPALSASAPMARPRTSTSSQSHMPCPTALGRSLGQGVCQATWLPAAHQELACLRKNQSRIAPCARSGQLPAAAEVRLVALRHMGHFLHTASAVAYPVVAVKGRRKAHQVQ